MVSKEQLKKGLFLIFGGMACFSGGYLLTEQFGSAPSLRAHSAESEMSRQRDLNLAAANAAAAFCSKVIEEGHTDDLGRFRASLALLSADDENYLIYQLSEKLHEDPDEFGSLVQALSQAIYQEDPIQAFDFMLNFTRSKPLLNIERFLYKKSLEEDPTTVLAYLESHLEGGGYHCGPQLQQIASIYTKEKKGDFKEWTDWLNGKDVEEQWDLVRGGLEATARHAAPDQRDSLLSDMTEK